MKAILGGHPYYKDFEPYLSEGMGFVFKEEIPEEKRKEELEANVARGNHKSAVGHEEKVMRLLAKDVKHGFALPISASAVKEIPGAMVQPCGIAIQHTLEPSGERTLKERLTHDMSFSITEKGISVNDRVDMEAYTEMVYGWCLSRVVHFIVALRAEHPQKKIFIAKYDFSDAYRRVSFAKEAVNQSILIVGGIAYAFLRLTFGGSPNPPAWCAFSEMVTDLSKDLPLDPDWEPTEVKSPITEDLKPKTLPADVPMAQARSLSVNIPTEITGRRSDCFIDDIIRVFLETADRLAYLRQTETVPLAVHVTTRPHAGEAKEPVPRRPLLSPSKLEAEGTPAEVQIVLGWELDTRNLVIRLPTDKFLAWTADIAEIIEAKKQTQHNWNRR